jgi:hypothetical protein
LKKKKKYKKEKEDSLIDEQMETKDFSLLLTISSIFISYADDSQFLFSSVSALSLVGFFTPTNPASLS